MKPAAPSLCLSANLRRQPVCAHVVYSCDVFGHLKTLREENGGITLRQTMMNMADTRLLEEIDRKMKEILARSPAVDLEKNLRALLQSAFGRLDLVTREEFDVQREVLARTRAKLQELETKLAELESRNEDRGLRTKQD